MNHGELSKVKAAMHQFMLSAPHADRSSASYRREWTDLLDRVARIEATEPKRRRRKAAAWIEQLDSVKPQ